MRFALLVLFLGIVALGCSSDPGLRPTATDVNGTATFADGKPVKDVRLNFFPTEKNQVPGSAELKADGKFAMQLVPGKYTFAFEQLKNPAAFKAIPPAYQSNSGDHMVDVQPGKEVEVQIK